MNKIQSDVISFLRFPLILAVVSIHTVFQVPDNFVGYHYFAKLLSCLTGLAVPVFFIISSFLFFQGWDKLDLEQWKRKNRSRIKTLLIPYLLWNLFYLLFMLLVQFTFPTIFGGRKFIVNYSIYELINSFWNFGGMYYGMPILYSFWFIRNLLLLNLLAPIIYILVKKIPFLWFPVVLVLFLLNPFSFKATDMDWIKSILFYSLGCYLGIKKVDFSSSVAFKPLSWIIVILLCTYFITSNDYAHFFYQSILICGTFFIPKFVRKGFERGKFKCNSLLLQSTFFIYAFHLFIITPFNHFWSRFLPLNSWTASIMKLLIPVIITVISILIYQLLKRIFPCLSKILVGGR